MTRSLSIFSLGQWPGQGHFADNHLTLGPPRRWPCSLLPHFHVPEPDFLPSHRTCSRLLVSKVPESHFLSSCSPSFPPATLLLPSPLVLLVEPPGLRHSSPPAPSTILARGLTALSVSFWSEQYDLTCANVHVGKIKLLQVEFQADLTAVSSPLLPRSSLVANLTKNRLVFKKIWKK